MDEIYNLLLSTIGLSFKEGRLFDDDKMSLVLLKQKYIAENESDIMRNNSILFDPINNRKLAQYLFNIYIDKEQEDGEMYIVSYQVVPEMITKDRDLMVRKKLLMIFGDARQVETNYYYNDSLTFIEAIFTASGAPIIPDLSPYDNSEKMPV